MTATCNNQSRKHHNMKEFIALVCIGLLLALMGCGGGGGGGATTGPEPAPVIIEPEQPAIPPPLSVFDCNSDGPVQGSEVATLPGGIFRGTLFDCTTDTAEYVYAVVNDQGDFSIVSSAGLGETVKQLTGSLHTDGDVFHGSGDLYTGPNNSSPLWIDGYITERRSLDGRWGSESGSYGFFQVSSSSEAWSFEPPLNTPLMGWRGDNGTSVTWTFEADGHVSAADTTGCAYAGQMTKLTLPQFNVFEIELMLSGCALAGIYSGLAAASSGWDVPFVLEISVDDGAGRALSISVIGVEAS
jgi:hypothetical protein